MTAEKIFKSVVQGLNAFTPELVAYYRIEGGAIELSSSRTHGRKNLTASGFMEDVYGVTVVVDGEYKRTLSNLFQDYKDAVDYINTFNPTHKEHYVRYNAYGDSELETIKL